MYSEPNFEIIEVMNEDIILTSNSTFEDEGTITVDGVVEFA